MNYKIRLLSIIQQRIDEAKPNEELLNACAVEALKKLNSENVKNTYLAQREQCIVKVKGLTALYNIINNLQFERVYPKVIELAKDGVFCDRYKVYYNDTSLKDVLLAIINAYMLCSPTRLPNYSKRRIQAYALAKDILTGDKMIRHKKYIKYISHIFSQTPNNLYNWKQVYLQQHNYNLLCHNDICINDELMDELATYLSNDYQIALNQEEFYKQQLSLLDKKYAYIYNEGTLSNGIQAKACVIINLKYNGTFIKSARNTYIRLNKDVFIKDLEPICQDEINKIRISTVRTIPLEKFYS